jgi:carbonic anhydrase
MVGAGAALAASAFRSAPLLAAEPPSEGAPNALSPDAALQRLMQGNERYAARASAQFPIAAILSCSDSRVVPDLVFDQSPGDLFVVRLAGNFLDDDGLASLEYAVKFLGAPLLMVVGHTNCGAVSAAVKVVRERAELPGHLPELIKLIEPAVIAAHERHPSDLVAAAIEENVKLNVKRMYGDSPILSEALAAKTIGASGGVYDIATGKINLMQ